MKIHKYKQRAAGTLHTVDLGSTAIIHAHTDFIDIVPIVKPESELGIYKISLLGNC